MKRPLAYITAPWSADDIENTEDAAQYCRKVYDAGFTPVCPVLFLPLFLNDPIPQEHKDGIDMYAIWREYFTVLALIFAAPLIFRVLMKDAYLILVTTLPGQALLVLLLAAVVYSLIKAVRLNRPLLM